MQLTTDRLLLRPIRHADARDVERVIFEDPEIVKGLAHDGSDPEVRRRHARNWSGFGPDGDSASWRACETGLYVINDRSGSLAPADQFLGVAGFYLEDDAGRWGGELFYALDSAFHGRGITSEACAAVMQRFRSLANAGSVYAVYWQLLNPASAKILAGLGFEADGSQPLLDEYDADIAAGIRDFEIWRLANATADQQPRIAAEAATKLGHIESEGISSPAENIAALLGALGDQRQSSELQTVIETALQHGRETPGLAMMRYHAA
jgi:RimJ/RimL family protein N-acetyltransferase